MLVFGLWLFLNQTFLTCFFSGKDFCYWSFNANTEYYRRNMDKLEMEALSSHSVHNMVKNWRCAFCLYLRLSSAKSSLYYYYCCKCWETPARWWEFVAYTHTYIHIYIAFTSALLVFLSNLRSPCDLACFVDFAHELKSLIPEAHTLVRRAISHAPVMLPYCCRTMGRRDW